MQRRDFPSHIMEINGLNPWNLLLLATVSGAVVQFIGKRRKINVPRTAIVLMALFYFAILIAYVRAAMDLGSIPAHIRPGLIGFTGEFIINRIKFILPAVLLYLACDSRRDLKVAIGVILFSAVAYACLVIKRVPMSSLLVSDASDFMRYRHRIDRDIGLMAIDMSMLLAGSFWALFVVIVLAIRKSSVRLVGLLPLVVVFVGMALCHSRGGYVGFLATGIMLAAARWPKMLLLLPIAIGGLFVAIPAVPARLGMGVGVADVSGSTTQDWDQITAGRLTDLWPVALDEFGKSPLVGYGGYACTRTQIRDRWLELGNAPSHPHNAYLEVLLDMGIIGFLPVMALYGAILSVTFRLFRVRDDRLAAAVGGMGLAMITTLLVTAMGCQTFYPAQSTVLYWCIWALGLRLFVDRAHARMLPAPGMAYRSRMNVRYRKRDLLPRG
ncbi:MAG: O-antigen ligase family protein [Phycisphaerae bacterium]